MGQSAVVVPVRAAESVVSTWRARFDPSAAQGMPAHITALYPFLPAHRLTGQVITGLRVLCAAVPAVELRFRRTARFPGVLYLDPEPIGWIRELTASIARNWPNTPPYGGIFDEVIPHLTVAYSTDNRVLDEVVSHVVRSLPVDTTLAEARLYLFDGGRWQPEASLPFQSRGGD